MGDEQHRHLVPPLQSGDQIQDLLLDRHIERGRRLVGDEELGLAGDRHRDHDPLLLSARHLRGIGVDLVLRIGNADFVEQRDGALSRLAWRQAHVQPQHLAELEADREHRVERSHWLLEDHRDVGAAELAQLQRVESDQVPATVENLAARENAGIFLGQQPQDRQRGHRFAAPGLAHQSERGILRDVEADAFDGLEGRVLVQPEVHPEITDG